MSIREASRPRRRTTPGASSTSHATTPASADALAAAQQRMTALRDGACERARPLVRAGGAPIRVMARMVAELEAACRAEGIPDEITARGVVNRTIGDVDVRRVSAADDGPEFVSLADDIGVALPGEVIGGYRASGQRYRHIRRRMCDFERILLDRHVDLRIYDIAAVGNPLLRERLAARAARAYGIAVPPSQIHLSLGSLDGLDKFFRALAVALRAQGRMDGAVVFPAPGFNVPEWQAQSVGLRVHRIHTQPAESFKVTPEQLRMALAEAPEIRALYLTVSNNPTAFSYAPEELRALFQVLDGTDVVIVADLAYIGTGEPAADHARMTVFAAPEVLARSVLCNSFSKSHTLTGDRFGWVAFGTAELARMASPGWTNTIAALPADWQLRYLAVTELFEEHPELEARIRALYWHRRERLVRQLHDLDREFGLFAQVNLDDGGTVYNWSQLRPGEDVFSLFSKTGIAGVPGSAFGYSDDFVRLSVGCIPVPAEQ